MLEIKNLSKRFGDQQVLDHINLKIEKGKVFVIIGPSGTGKSTLLRCINALERPEKGTIQLENQIFDYENLSKSDIQALRTNTSMVFQNSNLYRNKTAFGNVTTPLILVKKLQKSEAEKVGLEYLEKVGMLEKKDAYPETLSGGEKQRVAISRALINQPGLILADEPTGNLDSKSGKTVVDALTRINGRMKKTIIMVTHDPQVASRCKRILFLKDGVILDDLRKKGSTEEFYGEILERMKDL